MAPDYNANLIVELYTAQTAEEATRISDEMVEIGDPIFPKQIYEAYKRFKTTSRSHYFVSDLVGFKSKDVAEILKEIASTTERSADISMMIDYLADIEYFEPSIMYKVVGLLNEEINSNDITEYDLEKYYKYLSKSEDGKEVLETLLKKCFEDNNQDKYARKASLELLLKIKKNEYLNFYYENYDSIKGQKSEIIFVEEISTWTGPTISLLHKKILENGSNRAKEILQAAHTKKTEEEKQKVGKEQIKIKEIYQTADLTSDIGNLRQKINKITVADDRFGFPLFTSSEEFYQQSKPAQNKETLVGYSMTLRTILGGFNEKITNFDITKEVAEDLLPNIKELSGSINKFHLFLLQNKITVDPGVFGLRNLNRIVSKLAHPEEVNSDEFINLLKEENLIDFYKQDKWPELHREILLRYRNTLEKLVNTITK